MTTPLRMTVLERRELDALRGRLSNLVKKKAHPMEIAEARRDLDMAKIARYVRDVCESAAPPTHDQKRAIIAALYVAESA